MRATPDGRAACPGEVSTSAGASIGGAGAGGGLNGLRIAGIVLCSLISAGAAAEESGSFPVRLLGGAAGGLGAGEPGLAAAGRALGRGARFAAEGAAREGWYLGDSRSVGALFVGARYTPPGPAFARVGFAHHHEVPKEAFFAAPGTSIAGTGEGIRHRSGLEAGVGLWGPVSTPVFDGRMGWAVDLSGTWLPDDKGPAAYALIELGLYLDVGQPR